MLLEFSCSNYKSIKDEVVFSAIASKDDTNEEQLKPFLNFRVLRTAAIYGPNGSGKSNFIKAIKFMIDLVNTSVYNQPGEFIYQPFHKKLSSNQPSEFNIQFVKDNIRYAYGFSIKENLIDEEYLYFFPNKRKTIIFERENMEIILGDKYKLNKALIETKNNKLKNNRLFLSCAANDTNIEEIERAFLFFTKDIVIYDSNNNWKKDSIKRMSEDVNLKDNFVEILKHLGTGIKDVKVRYEKAERVHLLEYVDSNRNLGVIENLNSKLVNNFIKHMGIYEAKIVYDDFETDLEEESTGIQKLFEIICPMLDVLINGKVMIFDEIEVGLHEAIAYQIIDMFMAFESEKFAQLFFTTHDTSLLDSKLFRRDQIWFTELKEDRATDLYSLLEIKNVRKDENLAKGYVLGKYGAIPILNKNFSDVFNKVCKANGGI